MYIESPWQKASVNMVCSASNMYYNSELTTHLLGVLSIITDLTSITSIVNDGSNILILDSDGLVWTLYNYEQAIQLKITGVQDAVQRFDNIAYIADSYILDHNGKIYPYNPLNILAFQKDLIPIGETTTYFSKIISNRSYTYALDQEGNSYILKMPFTTKSEDPNTQLMLKLNVDLPLVDIYIPYNIYPGSGIGISSNGECSLITYELTLNDQGTLESIEYKALPLEVFDVKTIYTIGSETIFIKNNGSAWSWFTHISINDFSKPIGPESSYKKLI